MNFDVMGVSVEGKIVGFRRVKWASFQPNFFVQFQGGVFEDFPKTHVASIGNMSSEEALRTQNQLVDEFPNISIIDVGQVVDKLSEKMAWALKAMAALVLAASVSVVLSIQAFHIQRKAGERSLLHLLGLARFRIRRIESIEIWVLSFSAVSLGWLLSYLIAWPVTHLLFERLPSFSWGSLLIFIVLSPSLLKLGLFFIPVQERRREEP